MASYNQVNIIGHVGRAPELKEFDGGGALCNLSVATSRAWKDKSDQWQEATTWHNVVVRGDAARRADRRLDKGSLVFVTGTYESRKYTAKDGGERTIYEVHAFKVVPLDKLPKGDESGGGFGSGGGEDDDIPF